MSCFYFFLCQNFVFMSNQDKKKVQKLTRTWLMCKRDKKTQKTKKTQNKNMYLCVINIRDASSLTPL